MDLLAVYDKHHHGQHSQNPLLFLLPLLLLLVRKLNIQTAHYGKKKEQQWRRKLNFKILTSFGFLKQSLPKE